MKIKFIILIINLLNLKLGTTQNLVTNGDFESYTSLPTAGGECNKCNGWSNLNGSASFYWPYASTDYLHTLGSGAAQLPNSGYGTVTPYSGNATMGFVSISQSTLNFREYLSTPFSTPMVIGNTYNISFWITNGDSNLVGENSSNRIGLRLSTLPLSQNLHEPIGGIPQLEIAGQVWTLSWQVYNFNFIADSAYNYLTIGNFYNDLQTSTVVHINASIPLAYYFIDNLKVIPNIVTIGNTNICFGDSTTITAFNDTSYIWVDSLNPSVVISNDSSITVSPPITTTYMIYGSNDTSSVTVFVNYPPIINLGNDTTLCQGDILLLNATLLNATYLWQDFSTNPTFNITSPGSYWVEITVNNCSITDTINVSYYPSIVFNLGNDTTLCQGEILLLDATTTNATYLWQDLSTNPTFIVSQQGTYSVEVTVNNCTTTNVIVVSYNPLTPINLGADTTLCQGDTLMLDVTTSNATYLWQDSSTSSIFYVSQQGTYWFEVTAGNCSVTDTINIDFNPLPIFDLGGDTTLCLSESLTLVATNFNATYLWQDNSTNSTFNVTQQGVYWVGTTLNNCTVYDTIVITYGLPIVIFGNDTVMCEGENLILNVTAPNATYLWQDNTTNSTFNVTEQGTYWSVVTNICGIISDTINVIYKNCDAILILPNVITPNHDGMNDLFTPIIRLGITYLNTQIFNRWGELIFSSNYLEIGWDGRTTSGSLIPDGTYFWIINYKDLNNNEFTIKGFVSLLK